MKTLLKEIALQLVSDTRRWWFDSVTHVALPIVFLFLHLFSLPIWHYDNHQPMTLWSVLLLALLFWVSGGLVDYLDSNGHFAEGPLAEFFATIGLDEADETEDTI